MKSKNKSATVFLCWKVVLYQLKQKLEEMQICYATLNMEIHQHICTGRNYSTFNVLVRASQCLYAPVR